MAIIYENHCVDCGLPCLGKSCPNRNVPVRYCDHCDNSYADYYIDGSDYCSSCAENYINEVLDDMTIAEKAKACGMVVKDYK